MFDGRVAVVTGGTCGVSGAIAETLARAGAHVAAGCSKGKGAAEAFRKRMAQEGRSVSYHQGRVDDFDDCKRVIDEVARMFDRVDYVTNNAGITIDKTLRKMTPEDWQSMLSVNLSGAFNVPKAALGHMIERGFGRIVNS